MLRGHVFKLQTFEAQAFAHFIDTFLQGNCGITKGCELNYTSTSVTISEGFFCVKGRLLEITGNETNTDITNTGYYTLVCEIDLTKENTKIALNQAKIKLIKNANSYAILQQDDLFNNGNIYQFEFARFKVVDSAITDFEDRRTFLKLESLYKQILDNFDKTLNDKSEEADIVLQKINEELNNIVDSSAFVLKTQIQTGTEIPKELPEGTIYFQIFDD